MDPAPCTTAMATYRALSHYGGNLLQGILHYTGALLTLQADRHCIHRGRVAQRGTDSPPDLGGYPLAFRAA